MELFGVLFAESLLFFAALRVDELSIQEIVFISLNIECAWKFVEKIVKNLGDDG